MKKQAEFLVPILLLVVFALILAVNLIPASSIGLDNNPYMSIVAIQLIVYSVPTFFYCRFRGLKAVKHLRLILPKLSQIFFIFYAMVFLIAGSALLSIAMYRIAPSLFTEDSIVTYSAFAMNDTVFDGLFVVIAFAILPALTEEMLFRGVVMSEYEHNGAVFAAVISSLVFAMSHFSLTRLPIYFFSGIVLAMVVYTTRSLIASVIVHSVNNAFVLFLEKYALSIAKKENISLVLLIVSLVLITALALFLMMFTSAGIYRTYAETDEVNDDYMVQKKDTFFIRTASSYLSITFIILFIVFILSSAALIQ